MLSQQTISLLKQKASAWAAGHEVAMILDTNYCSNAFGLGKYELIIAAGVKKELKAENNVFDALKDFLKTDPAWTFGFFSYDIKNQLENLHSHHPDGIGFPLLYFFQPEYLVVIDLDGNCVTGKEHVEEIIRFHTDPSRVYDPVVLEQRVSKDAYIKDVQQIRDHIVNGDVYELNYCVEFFSAYSVIDPVSVYEQLRKKSAVPFGSFFKLDQRYLIGASPERFIMKNADKLYSQPIKGTARRGITKEEDRQLKYDLLHSEKERAENLMIVDLVRNDLARSSETGSVNVEELFGIYTFPQVHQMISTVSSTIRKDIHAADAIKNAFPMGSMTGAPKIMSMQLIEKYEQTRRGLYSGSVGYFSPDGDFDFNVVIRSIQYHAGSHYLNFEVGGAITYDSDPEKEYEECLLKAKAMTEVLTGMI